MRVRGINSCCPLTRIFENSCWFRTSLWTPKFESSSNSCPAETQIFKNSCWVRTNLWTPKFASCSSSCPAETLISKNSCWVRTSLWTPKFESSVKNLIQHKREFKIFRADSRQTSWQPNWLQEHWIRVQIK